MDTPHFGHPLILIYNFLNEFEDLSRILQKYMRSQNSWADGLNVPNLVLQNGLQKSATIHFMFRERSALSLPKGLGEWRAKHFEELFHQIKLRQQIGRKYLMQTDLGD